MRGHKLLGALGVTLADLKAFCLHLFCLPSLQNASYSYPLSYHKKKRKKLSLILTLEFRWPCAFVLFYFFHPSPSPPSFLPAEKRVHNTENSVQMPEFDIWKHVHIGHLFRSKSYRHIVATIYYS